MTNLARILVFIVSLALCGSAAAAEYRCNGDRVQKGASTRYTVRKLAEGFSIEKGGATIGVTKKKADEEFMIKVGKRIKATFDIRRVYKSDGATWALVSDTQREFDCPGPVAATLWVLQEIGKL